MSMNSSVEQTIGRPAEIPSESVDVRGVLLAETPFGPDEVTKLERAIAGYQSADVRIALGELDGRINSGKAADRDLTAAGIAAFLLGRHDLADGYLRRVNKSGLAAFYHGEALVGLRTFGEAEEAYVKASDAGYDPVQCVLRRVGAIRMSGRADEADQFLTKHAREAATRAEYSFQKGCILADRGDTFGAVEYFERAVDMDPHHTGAMFRLAGLNDLLGNDDEAIRLYEQSLSTPPLFLGALLNLGILYEDKENYSAAAYCFRRVLDVYPNHERARLFLKDIEAAGDMYYDEDAARRQRELEHVMKIPVADFELSARARNCLDRASIVTLGDLTRIGETELLAGKNFGETSLTEIRDMMAAKGLRIGQLLRIEPLAAPKAAPTFVQEDIAPEQRAVLERPVTDLNLSVRSRKCLSRLGINTLGEVVSRTPDELLSVRNFGVTSLNEIRQKLVDFDLRLRND
ncbi:MAG: DNA-directed RNA polymerase subunit alpha C-terminal domain-containing protein [Planctomycetaceae bacterium]